MKRSVLTTSTLAALVTCASLVAGCGGSSDVNPVDVLKKVGGCALPPGSSSGMKDAYGSLYSSCQFPSGASVSATNVTLETARSKGYRDAQPDDAHKIVSGKGFYLVVTADPESFSDGTVDLAYIAKAVGGKVSQ